MLIMKPKSKDCVSTAEIEWKIPFVMLRRRAGNPNYKHCAHALLNCLVCMTSNTSSTIGLAMLKVSETLGETQSHPWRMLRSLCCLQVTTLARGPGPSRVSGLRRENNQLLNVLFAGAYFA